LSSIFREFVDVQVAQTFAMDFVEIAQILKFGAPIERAIVGAPLKKPKERELTSRSL
jgi:hypothetical protein